jgi:hypothetical protein
MCLHTCYSDLNDKLMAQVLLSVKEQWMKIHYSDTVQVISMKCRMRTRMGDVMRTKGEKPLGYMIMCHVRQPTKYHVNRQANR